MWLPMLCAGLVLTGCMAESRYDYDVIKKEYADVVCKLAPAETDPKGAPCAPGKALALSDAIDIALANNPDKMMAVSRIRQAEAHIRLAGAAFFPYLGFYTEYVRADAPSAYLFKTIDQRQLPPNTNFNAPDRLRNWESGVNASLNLFNGGRDLLNRKMAETGLAISELDRRTIENSLTASVIQAYYNAMAAEAFIGIAEESEANVGAELRIMNVRFREGGALKSDILSLEVRLARAKEDVVRRKNAWNIALTALANVMGVNPAAEIVLEKTDPMTFSLPETYEDGLAGSLERRPEIRQVRAKVSQARMALDAARAGYLPRVDAQAQYYMDDPDMAYDAERDNWRAALVFNWDLFTGFSTCAEIQKAEAALTEALAADRKTELSVRTDVRTAYLNLAEAQARLEVARSSVAMAEESHALVKRQYEGGSAPITRYLEAELDLNRSRVRSAAAFYDAQKARADVGRAVGFWAKDAAP